MGDDHKTKPRQTHVVQVIFGLRETCSENGNGCMEWGWVVPTVNDQQGNMARSAHDAVYITENNPKRAGPGVSLPHNYAHTCSLTSLLYVHSGSCSLVIVAGNGFDSAGLVRWDGCWTRGSGDYV